MLYVTRFDFDTGGLIYPKAINQLFTGLYGMELYLAGLFFLVRNQDGQVCCVGQGVIMMFTTCLTAAYQILLNHAFGPLCKNLPVMLDAVEHAPLNMESVAEHHNMWIRLWQKYIKASPDWAAGHQSHLIKDNTQQRDCASITGPVESISADMQNDTL